MPKMGGCYECTYCGKCTMPEVTIPMPARICKSCGMQVTEGGPMDPCPSCGSTDLEFIKPSGALRP